MKVRRFQLPIALFALVLVLAACGNEIESPATQAPTATVAEATPVGLTVGQLADRIAEGWQGIDRYHSVTTTSASGSPVAGSAASETIEEAILPDQRRQVVMADGTTQSEIVAAGGNIYGRGSALPGIDQPNRDPEVWITINGNILGPGNAYSAFYQSLMLPVQPPYAGLDQSDRDKPAQELGLAQIGAQTCQQYRIVDTTLTGERIEVVLALAGSGLVCSIQTISDQSVTTTIYTYDQPAQIALPASPVAAPAENG